MGRTGDPNCGRSTKTTMMPKTMGSLRKERSGDATSGIDSSQGKAYQQQRRQSWKMVEGVALVEETVCNSCPR